MVLLEELLQCQINKWYHLFKPHTIPTLFLPLPASFLSYLQGLSLSADGSHSPTPFLLPCSASNSAFHKFPAHSTVPDPDSNFDSDSDSSDSDSEVKAPSFPELESEVEKLISALGGGVVPKLNWSAPKDATWMSPFGSLKCESFSEICLLLHSSDCIIHDLTEALPSSQDYANQKQNENEFQFFLALRKWVPDIRPEYEFRCFVREKKLVGISQREVTAFYPSLLTQKDQIVDSIVDFFDRIVKPVFVSRDYTFDVYLTQKRKKVILVDFNPWGRFTLPLLFEWEELEQDREEVELRLVESTFAVRPGMKTAVPYDYLDTSEGSGWDEFFRKAELEIRRQSEAGD
ncbi:hypothetical protein LUZ63_012580 [Rhynchospora breviuscula]|uniref:Cell division cycle protein 123 n=1 Tax=Rhynchospora breviuscula TaxID=2022672 RepID=A0A9Q0CKY2_9POAL|nr:hypothetical protein LUZ63_012580 [Rhynchospora breviuscula]